MWRKKKEHRIFDRIILAVFLLVAFVYTMKFLMGFFNEKTFRDLGSGFVEMNDYFLRFPHLTE